jgi:hypothetical protein
MQLFFIDDDQKYPVDSKINWPQKEEVIEKRQYRKGYITIGGPKNALAHKKSSPRLGVEKARKPGSLK